MGQLIVRNLEDDILAALKAQAAAHGRSAEAEHRAILREVLSPPEERSEDWFERARVLRSRLSVAEGPDTTDLIRADRDRNDDASRDD